MMRDKDLAPCLNSGPCWRDIPTLALCTGSAEASVVTASNFNFFLSPLGAGPGDIPLTCPQQNCSMKISFLNLFLEKPDFWHSKSLTILIWKMHMVITTSEGSWRMQWNNASRVPSLESDIDWVPLTPNPQMDLENQHNQDQNPSWLLGRSKKT